MALLGANGAGKTTLLRVLAGLLKPESGTIRLNGIETRQDLQYLRRNIGFLAHQPYLYEELTVMENLLFFGQMYGIKGARERALTLVERVGLSRRVNERIGVLSRGQLQRISLVRALIHDPLLLLFDEPDTGLDESGNALLNELLQEHAQRGGGVLFTTHQLEHALSYSDRLIALNKGRLIFQRPSCEMEMGELRNLYQKVVA